MPLWQIFPVYPGWVSLSEGLKVCFQIDFFVVQAKLLADIVPVVDDGAFGHVKRVRDLLGGPFLLDKAGNPDFGGGQAEI